MTAAQCVRNGIELLDEKGPENWRDMIDLDTLDIQMTNRCIIGQLYKNSYFSYSSMLRDIGAFGNPQRYGFDAHLDYEELTKEWKLALSA